MAFGSFLDLRVDPIYLYQLLTIAFNYDKIYYNFPFLCLQHS